MNGLKIFLKKNPFIKTALPLLIACVLPLAIGGGCGGTGTGNPATANVVMQSAPLAGANAASLEHPGLWFIPLMDVLLGVRSALAAVSPFTSFKLCNDTLVMKDAGGNTIAVDGSTQHQGLGLITFSPTADTPMTLASLSIAAGTQVKEIDITSAISTTLCPGFSDAVEFNPNSGAIHISQNTAFKFIFATPVSITGTQQTLSLLLGQIVNGMVALGAGLNNSTIQTVNVGQAK